jgi:hypothetical protein
LIFLIPAVLLDLAFRWIAFKRVESVAIDVSIFSCIYSALEFLKDNPSLSHSWGVKTLILLFIVLFLSIMHMWLKIQLDEKITDVFEQLQLNLVAANLKDAVASQHAIANWAIDVALLGNKPGKRKRRARITSELKNQGLDPKNHLNDDSFLLPRWLRILSAVAFGIGAIASIYVVIYF